MLAKFITRLFTLQVIRLFSYFMLDFMHDFTLDYVIKFKILKF